MAVITINEISKNYSYATGTSSFATVALPITAMWGPGYFDPTNISSNCDDYDTDAKKHSAMLDKVGWQRFAANQAGLESFISTYRGPIANYRMCNDFSYQLAITLLTAGYDILVCRLSPGAQAESSFVVVDSNNQVLPGSIEIEAKYPGTFGNNIRVEFKPRNYTLQTAKSIQKSFYWNLLVYIVDDSGVKNAVENKIFTFHVEDSNDNIPYWREVEFDFIDMKVHGAIQDRIIDAETQEITGLYSICDELEITHNYSILHDGTDIKDLDSDNNPDTNETVAQIITEAKQLAALRYPTDANAVLNTGYTYTLLERNYVSAFDKLLADINSVDRAKAIAIRFREWVFTHLVGVENKDGEQEGVYDLLKDKLSYNPQRIISPGWDDQDFLYLFDLYSVEELCPMELKIIATSPIHRKLMDVAYYSRCATSLLDIPRSLAKKDVYNETSEDFENWGYAQKLARYNPDNTYFTVDMQLYHSHSALFTCWGRYTYSTLARQHIAPPSFLALMIQRAMILNQALQYEWILPTDRKQNLRIGKLDYDITAKYLNEWQTTEGVGVNCITKIPDLGTTLWGNSTLFEVPPATYQALANLSTRYLVNAVEDVVYKVGISITFQYNNSEAYSSFVAGCIPILDTMKNAGAIQDYLVKMSLDINELDQVNANSVIGKIYLIVNGVINDITVDLIALPPNTNLDQYR